MKKLLPALLLATQVLSVMPAEAAGGAAPAARKGKVLLVTSSTNALELRGGRVVHTGYILAELVTPAQRLIDEGYEVDVATPDGSTPAMDGLSVDVTMFGNDPVKFQKALVFALMHPTMQRPLKLSDVVANGLSKYSAVYVPGGHAPMNDLVQDENLGKVLRYFHENNRPTAFLCHGPIASLAALPQAKAYRSALAADDIAAAKAAGTGWQYAGYRMAIFSNSEEVPVQKDTLKGQLPFSVADALRGAGGRVEHGPDWGSFVVRDRELITGQNPASDHALADALVKALAERPPVR
ncbi:type 1 glutamine amidotransferase domain-containing protein [Roseateles sp. P5_E11]